MGVTFYWMLTGKLPFDTTDPLELIHCHLAQVPDPANSIRAEIPGPLSNIIQILLAKNAEDRYQSSMGLAFDLKLCLRQWQQKKTIVEFPIKTMDFNGKFQIPQKLYGREPEIETLIQAFNRARLSRHEMVLVAGYSGTGKSALVHEIHRTITEQYGYFVQGKFDQFQRVIPYYAILQAFQDYMLVILGEKEEQLSSFRTAIQQAVGTEGKVLTDVLPALELILGPQAAVPVVGGTEAQNRFNYVFRKLVTALATKEHPLVLFIDDLQWADSASLNLLQVLMTNPEPCRLLCISAYRDNEVDSAHPSMNAVEEIKMSGSIVQTIHIGNLSKDTVLTLIAESLSKSKEQVKELSALVYQKTQGNAFFLTQFLKKLAADNFLRFDFVAHEWTWELEAIAGEKITENVIELMSLRIRQFPEETQNILQSAACIGNSFELETLSIIHQKTPREVKEVLHEALVSGLIFQGAQSYKFAHDRIQQAVYSMIPEQQKSSVHLRIGRLLSENSSPAHQEIHLFDIVNQWNGGIAAVSEIDQKAALAKLNLRAGVKAKQSAAFKPALDYLRTGISLLKSDTWTTQYELARDLHTEAAETAYLSGDFTQMDIMIDEVLKHVKLLAEKIKPYEIRILAFKARNQLLDAIRTGQEILAQLGEHFPKNPKLYHVMSDLVATKWKLRQHNNESLEKLPLMVNADKIAAMRIMADIASSSYWATPTLFPLVIFRMVKLSLRYGNTSLSAFAFATYGVIMCGVLGAMKSGYEFGKLGLILLEKFNAKEWKTQIFTPIYALIINWNEHVKNTLRPLKESYHIGLETGAIEFACINANIYCIHAYLCGKPLVKHEEETRAFSLAFGQFKQETNFNYNEVYHQGMLNFMGLAANPLVLTGTAYDEEKMMAQNRERNDKTGTFFIHFNKLILSYYFGAYETAKFHAAEARVLLEAVLAKFEIPNHNFYETLTLIALYPKQKGKAKLKARLRIFLNIRQMRIWSKDAPENYLHKYDLMLAEWQRIKGDKNAAQLSYDRAIAGASANDYMHEEALAYELAARFYLTQKSEDLSEFYFKSAYNAYREWGAVAKLSNLELNYPKFVSSINRSAGLSRQSTDTNSVTTVFHGNELDLQTVLKASTSISGEIVLSRLLKTLMQIVIENAGAQYGLLLLENDQSLWIEAKLTANSNEPELLQHIPMNQSGLLLESIATYVFRSGQSVVVNNATTDVRYIHDEYVQSKSPQSILCLPINNQGKKIGVLYLENNAVNGAFTQNRIDLLSLLSGQMAISIENARLYENIEQKVLARTNELALEKQKSDDLLLNILPAETAEELKREGRTTPKKYESVTVMFTDFKGFTQLSEKLSPEELVAEIDGFFRVFDRIIEDHGVEKIKTIGDAYMCVGGLPMTNQTHAEDVIAAAFDIQDWMTKHKAERLQQSKPYFEIRIGIHTGPVVAGVVGSKKFAYDIWGDTVNTASRMEAGSEAGKVNISGDTYQLIQSTHSCTYRGKIQAKNKGEIDMYFVDSRAFVVPVPIA
ncbi:MAG: adenylate/guanylate cyclase domain-containing protein [Saprospiraceae bacterium]